MKALLLFVITIATISCNEQIKKNVFTSQSDTLFIQTTLMKGDSLFNFGAGRTDFYDTSEWKQFEWFTYYPNYPVVYPDSIKNMKLSYLCLMFDTMEYFDIRTNQIHYQQNNLLADRQTLMVKGLRNNKEVLIIDENNNNNLTDDSIRSFQEWNLKSDVNLIPIKFNINIKNTVIPKTGWFKIGLKNGRILTSISQYLLSKLTIDNKEFSIGVADDNSGSFDYFQPILYPFAENGISRDTLIKGEVIGLGGYIKLGINYYKFDNLYNGSETIVLVKENNIETLIGTQIGMLAPSFKCTSTLQKSIELSDYKGKYLLITNVSACYSPISSYSCYKDLTNLYSEKMEILCLDKSPVALENNIKNLSLTGDFVIVKTKEEMKEYRPDFCSRTCFLINPEGRIIEKFEIFGWEKTLEKHFAKN